MAQNKANIAQRYARALFGAYQPSQLPQILEALQEIARIWQSEAAMRESLTNPAVSIATRVQIVRDLGQALLPADVQFSNFLALLAENRRIECISDLAQVFNRMLDELKKMLALQISSAFELSPAEKSEIKSKIESDFGSMASLSWSVEPGLLGGLLIRSGDKLYDSSVRGALDRIRSELIAS